MLMDINCSAVTSIAVDLVFDDGKKKHRVVALGDLISVEYNNNGLRRKAEGKVINISAVGADPKSWYIIVDSSDDFDSNKVRFSPMSILDLEIIRKADTLNIIQTPIGVEGVPYLRIMKGRLQYSKDGCSWHHINIDSRDIIEDAEGTVPDFNKVENYDKDEDGIEDAVY